MSESVYERVLGEQFESLAPELRAYFSLPPDGMVGHGAGVYEIAGSRHRWLSPVFAVLAWRGVLFPERGSDVPFTVTNTPTGDRLDASREFHFPGRTRVLVDSMRVVDGRLHDRVGKRGGLEVRFTLRVTDGALTMVSDRSWLKLGGLRLKLPGLLSARVELTERWDGDAQRVDVSLTHPLFGGLFEYRGRFTYAHVPA